MVSNLGSCAGAAPFWCAPSRREGSAASRESSATRSSGGVPAITSFSCRSSSLLDPTLSCQCCGLMVDWQQAGRCSGAPVPKR